MESVHMTSDGRGMSTELTDVYDALYQDISLLHAKWEVFNQLYVTSEETVGLLNESAPSFFRICQDMLIDDILLTISRLTDPHQTFNRDNLSMERLVAYVDESKYADLRDEIEQLLIEAKSKCIFARELRNRRIAHTDLSTRLQAEANPLPAFTKQQIKEALSALRAIMNKIETHFEDTTVLYEQVLMPGDGNSLIAHLRDARIYRRQKRQNLGG
jgi:AbiU2